MKKSVLLIPIVFLVFMSSAMAANSAAVSQKYAGYLTIASILVSLPAFVSLYLHIRKTNLGHVLFQPFLAIFVGFFGIMLNAILDMWRVFQGFQVDNITLVMGINTAISSVFIAAGCVILFLGLKKKGLFSYDYYHPEKRAHPHKQ